VLAHPLGTICSDAAALATTGPLAEGSPHPRAFGTFPRVLGHYARDEGLFALEQAVHKMTGLSARNFGLEGRGLVETGAFADLTLFDPARVRDTATFERPATPAEGIELVMVNGQIAWRDGRPTEARAGRVLRRQAERLDRAS